MPAIQETEPECPKCGGYGLVVSTDGAVSRCDCGQWDDIQYAHALERARIPRRFRSRRLETFQSGKGDRQRTAIREAALNYARTFKKDEDRGLMLRGEVGAGKTHVAVGILQEVIRRGFTGMYHNFTDLLAELRSSYARGSELTEAEILEPIDSVDLLVLDDLGAEAVSDWVRDRLYLIVNRRYESARAMLVTTNCDEVELRERVGARIVSRLHEMCDEFMRFPAEDYRIANLR